MNHLFGRIFLSASLLLLLFACGATASTGIIQEEADHDYVYFNRQRSPYHIEEDIYLRPGQTIKIDGGSEFLFVEGADICLKDGQCLRGDHLYKDGLGGNLIEVSSDVCVSIEEGASEVRYLVDQVDHRYDSKKELSVGLKSIFDPVIDLKIAENSGSPERHRVMIYLPESILDPNLNFNGEPPYEMDHDNGYTGDDGRLSSSSDRLPAGSINGKIFLQVEGSGEAWYVHPLNSKRYYLGRPADAFKIMRDLALGVAHDFIEKHDYFPDRVAGRILLDVEDSGRAYYINPSDNKGYYLGRPADAFKIMRELGIGIENDDLVRIPQA